MFRCDALKRMARNEAVAGAFHFRYGTPPAFGVGIGGYRVMPFFKVVALATPFAV